MEILWWILGILLTVAIAVMGIGWLIIKAIDKGGWQ